MYKIITFLFLSCLFLPGLAQQVGSSDGRISGHDYVDLGLPSGLKWATCNVGASVPSDYGNYYAWGEINTKKSYDRDNCKTRGKALGDISGCFANDAARANWEGSWRLPSKAEYEELIDNCVWTWTRLDGVNGYMVKGPSGKSIFLPAAGLRHGTSSDKVGEGCIYWSATTDEDNTSACGLAFDAGSRSMPFGYREYGRPVRAVSAEEKVSPPDGRISGHDYVDLGLPSGLKWATCNVGASSPSDYGDCYAWGEISTKPDYGSRTSTTYGKKMGNIRGNPSYDAARARWSGSWRLPTKADFDELLNSCTWTWTSQGGHKGYLVKGPNGRSIFLPAAGWRSGASLGHAGENGSYWSATPYGDGNNAYGLYFVSGVRYMCWFSRVNGRTVRAVSE